MSMRLSDSNDGPYIIRKASRGFGPQGYSAPTGMFLGGVDTSKDFDRESAIFLARALTRRNPVGFHVYHKLTGEKVWPE